MLKVAFLVISIVVIVLGSYNMILDSIGRKKLQKEIDEQVEKNKRPSSEAKFPDEGVN